jgi:hypothetical protein
MLGVLITASVALGLTALALQAFKPLLKAFDLAFQVGIAGLLGLGLTGFLTFFVGHVPSSLRWGVWIVILLAVAGAFFMLKDKGQQFKFSVPRGAMLAFPLVLVVFTGMALMGVLAPSDSLDWDSLAYHLAVPKLWLQAGSIYYIPFIHQSNFPFAVDNLYIWGELWGSQHGAKAFSLVFYILGMVAVFGYSRHQYGEKAGWWAALAFASVPAILWESGTAYIDVAHGLYGSFGALLVARGLAIRKQAWKAEVILGSLLLGLAVATKYTGLQKLVAVLIVALIWFLIVRNRQVILDAVAVFIIAIMLGAPWFVRNTVNVSNPVYPFFYEIIGAKNWDQFRADIYREEQKSFGVEATPGNIAHAVLGLAYQPGRYINPGQQQGLGFPMGAVGAAILFGAALFLIWKPPAKTEALALGVIAITLVFWFFLSQQSRYILNIAPLLAIFTGAMCVHHRVRYLAGTVVALQAAYTAYLLGTSVVRPQLAVVIGGVTQEQYLGARFSFYHPSMLLNQMNPPGKTALFDEVRGYYLDVPYFWANPGHSMLIPWEEISSGDELIDSLVDLGTSTVYVNLEFFGRESAQRWSEAAQGIRPYEPEERMQHFADLRTKWRVLVAEAAAEGRLRLIQPSGTGVIFEVVPKR